MWHVAASIWTYNIQQRRMGGARARGVWKGRGREWQVAAAALVVVVVARCLLLNPALGENQTLRVFVVFQGQGE